MTSRTWFTVGLLCLVGVLVQQSLQLAPASRVAPLWALLPTAVLLLAQLLADLNPRLGATRLIFRGSVAVPSRDAQPKGTAEGEAASDPVAAREDRRRRALRMLSWIVGLLGLVYFLGVYLATAVFLLLYLRLESRLRWTSSAVLATLATGLTYVVFGIVARVPFPPAALF